MLNVAACTSNIASNGLDLYYTEKQNFSTVFLQIVMFFHIFLLLVVTSQVSLVNTRTLYILPDDHNSTNNSKFFTLSQCVSNSEICFTSYTKLLFLSAVFNLEYDFILQNVKNFAIIGGHTTIKCTNSSVGIVLVNVTNIVVQDIKIFHCGKKYSGSFTTFYTPSYIHKIMFPQIATLHLHHCVSVFIRNVSITVNLGTDGIVVVNAMRESIINNVLVIVHIQPQKKDILTSNGLYINYYQSNQSIDSVLHIQRFSYKQEFYGRMRGYSVQNVFRILLLHTRYNVIVNIVNGEYRNLWNVCVVRYTGYRRPHYVYSGNHRFFIQNCEVYNNTDNGLTDLLSVDIYNCHQSYLLKSTAVYIYNTIFYYNSNMSSIISIATNYPCLTQDLVFMRICNCSFTHNKVTNVVANNEQFFSGQSRWSIYIVFESSSVSFNIHKKGTNLMLLISAQVKFMNVTITNNTFYKSVLKLQQSVLRIKYIVNMSNNQVRNIIDTMESSYILIYPRTLVTITNNLVHSVLTREIIVRRPRKTCYFQFSAFKQTITENKFISIKIYIFNNLYTAPMHLIDLRTHFSTCKWIDYYNKAFIDMLQTPEDVFNRTINMTKRRIDKNHIGVIPSSICKCTNSTNYDCTTHDINGTLPGETLIVNLIAPGLKLSQSAISMVTETTHLPPKGCKIIKAVEMTQTHTKTGCNQYNYTVWSDKTECEMYLSAEGIPEIFYVKLLPCPVGFSLQSHLQRCHCDPVLDGDVISVTTCNLADGTILRPANSWISADTVNGSHRYHVSSQCPFDYCLPYSSYLNLSTPNMQCQFNRFGVLCGHCQQGLSALFGSSWCKKCSNINLFIIIPIAIAGIVLVMMLFVLKLTVINGTIKEYCQYKLFKFTAKLSFTYLYITFHF